MNKNAYVQMALGALLGSMLGMGVLADPSVVSAPQRRPRGQPTPTATPKVTPRTVPSATPEAAPVEISFRASPSSVKPGEPTVISWTSKNATGCSGEGGLGTSGQPQNLDPGYKFYPQETTMYGIYCYNASGGKHARATVTVVK